MSPVRSGKLLPDSGRTRQPRGLLCGLGVIHMALGGCLEKDPASDLW